MEAHEGKKEEEEKEAWGGARRGERWRIRRKKEEE